MPHFPHHASKFILEFQGCQKYYWHPSKSPYASYPCNTSFMVFLVSRFMSVPSDVADRNDDPHTPFEGLVHQLAGGDDVMMAVGFGAEDVATPANGQEVCAEARMLSFEGGGADAVGNLEPDSGCTGGDTTDNYDATHSIDEVIIRGVGILWNLLGVFFVHFV